MGNTFDPRTTSRNPQTTAEHKKQVLLQILMPLGICILVLLALAVTASLGSLGETLRWANVSMIYMTTLAIVTSLVWFALAVAGIYLVMRLRHATPRIMYRIQSFAHLLSIRVRILGDGIVKPVMAVGSFSAGWKAFFAYLRK